MGMGGGAATGGLMPAALPLGGRRTPAPPTAAGPLPPTTPPLPPLPLSAPDCEAVEPALVAAAAGGDSRGELP
jgi:hypothetical protein